MCARDGVIDSLVELLYACDPKQARTVLQNTPNLLVIQPKYT
jgi:hypothetical protein